MSEAKSSAARKQAGPRASKDQLIASLRQELVRKEAELDAMRRISEATGSAFGSHEMLQGLAEIGRSVTDTDVCEIYLLSEDASELVLRASTENQPLIERVRIRVGEGITGRVALERRPVGISRRAYSDPRTKYYAILHEEEFESFLAVPLEVREKVIGVITVRTRAPHEYSREEEMLLASVAGQVAGAVEHLDRMTRLEHQASQFRALAQVSRMITSSAYLEEILQLLVSEIARHLNYKVVTIRLLNEDTQELVLHASQSTSRAYLNKPSIRVGQSIAGLAVKENRTVTLADVQTSDKYLFPEIAKEQGVRSLICVPLTVAGKALGVLSCYTGSNHEFTQDEIRTLETLAGQAAIAVSHARLTARNTLMQEMHHRVKNNLQQIASLLRMQLRQVSDDRLSEHLHESLNRIQAIAAVHDLLSRDDLEFVHIRKIAEAIIQHLLQSYAPTGCRIDWEVGGDDILLPMNQANHVALVLNELVQNALQHGISSRSEGRIEVAIAVQDERVSVTVRNDGEPLPDGFDGSKASGLGLQIVENLIRSGLAGRFSLRRAEMTEAEFSFQRGPS